MRSEHRFQPRQKEEVENKTDMFIEAVEEARNTESTVKRVKMRRKLENNIRAGFLTKDLFKTLAGSFDITIPENDAYTAQQIAEILVPITEDELKKIDAPTLKPDAIKIPQNDGDGKEKKEIISRTEHLIDLLLELNLEYTQLKNQGIFIIPEINKSILINDKANNATRIIHEISSEETILDIIGPHNTKGSLDMLPNVEKIIYTGEPQSWEEKIKQSLKLDHFEKKEKEYVELTEEEKKTGEPWITNAGLYTKIREGEIVSSNPSQNLVRQKAEEYKKTNPKWFDWIPDEIGHNRLHYSKQLTEQLIDFFSKRKKAPDSWSTNSGTAKLIGEDKNKVIAEAKKYKKGGKKYKESNNLFFGTYLDHNGRVREHYSPAFIELLREHFSNLKKQEEERRKNYTSNADLAETLGIKLSRLRDKAYQYSANHNDWIRFFKINEKPRVLHYNKELVQTLTKFFTEQKKLPDNWLYMSELATLFGKNRGSITKNIKGYLKKHPEWRTGPYSKRGKNGYRYSPELIDLLNKHFFG